MLDRRLPVALALLLLITVAHAAAQIPPQVPRLTERRLDESSYVDLARQWKQYMEAEGESANGLVNLGMAYDYAGEEDAALAVGRRAVELAPDDPVALEFLGKLLMAWVDDQEIALEYLEHCRAVNPDYEPGLTTLAVNYMRLGMLDEAEAVMRQVFERNLIPRPLQDYGYNTLVGLPQGAVLITAGDNDTFPVLALQAGLGLRPDVTVLNRSLLADKTYAKAEMERRPDVAPRYDIDGHVTYMVDGHPATLPFAIIDAMLEQKTAPLFLAVTAMAPFHGREYDGVLEGIALRVGSPASIPASAADLFLTDYRLDSASDWSYPWALQPALAEMMGNYVAAMLRTAESSQVGEAARQALIGRAEALAEFHGMDDFKAGIETIRQR